MGIPPNNYSEDKMVFVVKDNALVGASYKLDVVEQRLILLAIVEARESGKGINANDPLVVHASRYIEEFGVSKQTAYQALKDASKDLFTRQFSYTELSPKGNIIKQTSRWISQIGYVEAEASVQLIFSPAIVPLITRLEEKFTRYELKQVAKLDSKYAMRLYELLIQWRSIGKTPIFELETFRNQLGLGVTEYKAMCDFKKSVLDLALKQINATTDLKVTYEQHKKGVRVAGFTFRFKTNITQPKLETSNHDIFVKLSDVQRRMFANKLSELPEMGKYSQGTESYQQFAVRIAEMLQDPEKIKELSPYLKKVGYMPSNKKDTVNG